MTPLHTRVHKIVHRALGAAGGLVSLLQALKAIDLAPLFAGHTAIVVAGLGVTLAVLETLPVVVKVFETDED